MKKFIVFFVLLTGFLFASPVLAINTPPDQLVNQTMQEVLEIIAQDDEIKNGNHEKILALVEDKVIPHFDFLRMTGLAMGKNWRQANAQQRDILVTEFRDLLVRTYSNTLSRYQDETIEVDPINNLGGATDVIVKTMVIQGRGHQPVPIDYRMEKTDSGWKAYDVIVAGVSLVTNYRGSFDSQVRRGGIDGLIKTLTDKNRSLENK